MMNLKQLRDGLLLVEDLNYGAMIKQGDKTLLRFKLINQRNPDESIVNKDVTVRVMRDFQTLNYEKTVKAKAENVVEFSIDNPLRAGRYYIEFKVGDAIYPSDHRFYFDVTPSGDGQEVNIIEIVGVDTIVNKVLDKVDTDVNQAIADLNTTNQTVQGAEAQRATAESNRVSAEEQREIDHANRSAELAGKADKVVIENLVSNGNFSSPNHPEWLPNNNITYNIENNEIVVTGKGPTLSSGGNWFAFNTIKPLNDTSVYYITALAKGQGMAYIGLSYDGSGFNVDGNFRRITYLGRKITFPTAEGRAVIGGSLGDTITFKEVMAINLTQTFGAGNEPTKEEMDKLINITGYIDGEYALNNKEMLIWTLALIRQNKNAIVALGGA